MIGSAVDTGSVFRQVIPAPTAAVLIVYRCCVVRDMQSSLVHDKRRCVSGMLLKCPHMDVSDTPMYAHISVVDAVKNEKGNIKRGTVLFAICLILNQNYLHFVVT